MMSLRPLSLSISLALGLSSLSAAAVPPPPEPPAPPAPQAADADPAVATGRELSRLFLAGDTAAVWARMGPQMRAALGDAAALGQFREKLHEDLGEEQAVLEEVQQPHEGMQVYVRSARWSRSDVPVLMQWVFDGAGTVAGFAVRPQPQAAPSDRLDYQTRAKLRLPFDGKWYVFWGGRSIEQNYHASSPQQRFAYDLVKRVDGSSHRGDGTALADYYCWNEKILAPAAGTVVEAVDGLPDQAIGTRNTEAIAGNHVTLDLGQGEYALLAHLRQGSVAVEPGQRVAAGDELGRCGNSGNTSEPHLHFHLQDSAAFGEGNGLPAFFENYLADGAPVQRGEPVQGQVIAPAGEARP